MKGDGAMFVETTKRVACGGGVATLQGNATNLEWRSVEIDGTEYLVQVGAGG